MENEVRLIDMHTLWQCETCFHHYPKGCDTYCDHGESYRPAADKLTVIDPETLRPKGRWIIPTKINGRNFQVPHCSVCGEVPPGVAENNKYCPNCGAKMEG